MLTQKDECITSMSDLELAKILPRYFEPREQMGERQTTKRQLYQRKMLDKESDVEKGYRQSKINKLGVANDGFQF